jgi:hypothetical protein
MFRTSFAHHHHHHTPIGIKRIEEASDDLFEMDEDEPCSLSALTENITNSFVDTSKLLSYMAQDQSNIGMNNFKSKKPVNWNPLFNNTGAAKWTPAGNTTRVLLNPIGALSSSAPTTTVNKARERWRTAAKQVRLLKDPWAAEFPIDSYPTEQCIRHRYNAIKKIWVQDECVVKIDPKQFACGAMRGCFRL